MTLEHLDAVLLDDAQPTDETLLLRERFGEDFAPLGDVMHAVFGTRKRNPITVAEVPRAAFDAVVMRATGR